jgi:hypothetical protein
MLFAGRSDSGRPVAAAARYPSERPEHPIRKSKFGALETNLGQAPDTAEAAVVRLGSVLQKFNLDGNAAGCRMRNLSGEQPIVRTGRRTHDLPDLALPPFVTPEKTNLRRRAGFNPLELPLWKIHDHKSTRSVRKIKNGLPFRHRRAGAGHD